MNADEAGLVWIGRELRYFVDFKPMKRWKGQYRIRVKIGGKEHKINIGHVQRWPKGEPHDKKTGECTGYQG